ncbi:hypothetical protein BDW27_101389 [Nocardiopsis sp. L17-MgMaSL7]|nr:hypothetical protein BDW27_101389 [Nocardiopsis sp. L17-MgMaSL7]
MPEERGGLRRHRGLRDDHGAIFVEFAAMVPFMMLALALVWQVLLIGVTSMYASHGAAEAARQASVTPDDMARIDEEARKRVRAPWDGEDVLTTEVVEKDGARFARVSLDMPVFLPGVTAPWPITGEAKVVTEVAPRGTSDPEGVEAP